MAHDAHKPGQAHYDNVFRDLVGSAVLSVEPGTGDQDPLLVYVRRIAGSVFCGAGIDPSVVGFATTRAAERWGRDENEVDAMVGDNLLQTAAALMTDLR